MADFGDNVSTNGGFLDELLAGLNEAVISAQRIAEKQHIDMVDLYFDDDTGEPITMDLKIPSVHPDKEYEILRVPLITMTPISSIKIKELNMKFKVKLGKQVDTPSNLTQQIGTDSNQTTGALSIDMDSTDTSNMAEVEVKFEGTEPPEGVARINDQLIKTIIGGQITDEEKQIIWKNEALGAEWDYKEIPEDLKEISKKYKNLKFLTIEYYKDAKKLINNIRNLKKILN